ncbi:MAG TPA: acetylpolyamine amidohydrolase [Rhodospirillaceae bacterium]|nr:acetylpolyamine amidohydrolase [Rhodospirillaceae bacterium]MAX62685.1 acetylpolyamine amidohydrolase [Rhodospirillaceae bacterium]MBB57536.1 acetylpolyamine amidohydrolase [Rhodospirillaceae bacterium]HAJ23004.1 acetylpolyamine amidohydrolase [Rhodospirillaceae bacterium]HBM14663.1 acetylpolyamine amidohydrolase [Rhodospirillaceae bacterium]|tara:strand:- start:99089 stop:100111 length:1023 start_codon:yes stop_codon:yes gene_type:complete
MKAIFDETQRQHDPKHFMANGVVLPSPEQPARIDALMTGAENAGCAFTAAEDHGMGPLSIVHSVEYLSFLETIHTRWSRIEGASDEVIPNIHPDRRFASYPKSAVGQAGYHQADTACPIAAGTWQAAYWSAQSALTAADLVIDGDRAAYALCRPPGHHAFADMAGGFCFLNNAAIAAEQCVRAGMRPAILDVDVHHGNGTQGIFYHRSDVFTVSVHADPIRFYPFFWGHAHERGDGPGLGYNLNIPLTRGTSDSDYMEALEPGLDAIRSFGPDVVIVALGLDAYEEDPLKGLAITTEGFGRIGAAIGGLALPTLLIQEGGYLSDALGANLTSVLKGFESV